MDCALISGLFGSIFDISGVIGGTVGTAGKGADGVWAVGIFGFFIRFFGLEIEDVGIIVETGLGASSTFLMGFEVSTMSDFLIIRISNVAGTLAGDVLSAILFGSIAFLRDLRILLGFIAVS